MFILVTSHTPPFPVVAKVKPGSAAVGFNCIEDGQFYIAHQNIAELKLMPIGEAVKVVPRAYAKVYQVLLLNTKSSIELFLKNPKDFPYAEYLLPFPPDLN